MKTKKIVISAVSILVLIATLFSLTACLKIGLKKNSIVDRLKDAGASVEYQRTTPMTLTGSGYKFEDLILSKLTVEKDGESSEETLYIIFAGDENSADWAEERCREYLKEHEDECANWIVYRYERVIMCGHFHLLSIARSY